MAQISPAVASMLAEEVYGVHDQFELASFINNPLFSKKQSNKTTLTAQVGSRLINTKDSFGICARGAGEFSQDIFLIFRGSTFANYGADWLTNTRFGVTTSTTGNMVHAGFNSIFNSMRQTLDSFISQQSGTTTIHCIGHSLGGAIANLSAEWAAFHFGKTIKLYSFGAPRVGFGAGGFANQLTHALLPQNIHRVCHSNDPVTMIPIFPYSHAPTFGPSYHINYGGLSINPLSHMIGNYIKSINGKTWPELAQSEPPIGSIKRWLESSEIDNTDNVMFWNRLNHALRYAVNTVMKMGGIALTASATFIDQLAMILKKGLDLAANSAKFFQLLIQKMMKALGMKIVETTEKITVQLLRLILNKLTVRLYRQVSKAIRNL